MNGQVCRNRTPTPTFGVVYCITHKRHNKASSPLLVHCGAAVFYPPPPHQETRISINLLKNGARGAEMNVQSGRFVETVPGARRRRRYVVFFGAWHFLYLIAVERVGKGGDFQRLLASRRGDPLPPSRTCHWHRRLLI